MGLEPMTSPLPRECSTTELHQQLQPTSPSYRERRCPSTTRKAKKPSSTQVSDRNLPGSMVCQVSKPKTAITPSAIAIRPLRAGIRSTTTPTQLRKRMVHRGGFEPPYVIDGQIYSLLPLTTRPPVHPLQAARQSALNPAPEPCIRSTAS
jgi:hypothetical protein